MIECKWMHISSRRPLCKSELIAELDQKKNGIAILSGPSNCGKTMLLQEMMCRTQTPMFIYTCEQVVDSILAVAHAGELADGVPLFKGHPMNTIMAIEDIDIYFAGRPDTRNLLYRNLLHLAESCLVILTGIDLEIKMPDLFNYFPKADFHCAMNDQTEFWDLYYENGEKIPNRFHVREKSIPEGCYHLVVNVFIRDRQHHYLMGQRSADRKSFPLKWEGYGGSSLMGESSLDARIREAREELGISLDPKDAILIDKRVRKKIRGVRYQDILHTYLFEADEIMWCPEDAPTKDEVTDSQIFTLPEIRELHHAGQFHPDLDYIFDLLT